MYFLPIILLPFTLTLAIPLSNISSTTLTPRFDPTVMANQPIPDLAVKTYPGKSCKGKRNDHTDLKYNVQMPFQMRSYHLSRELGPDEVMSVYANAGWKPTQPNPIDPILNGEPDACVQFVWDVLPSKTGEGCHDLAQNLGCFKIAV